MQPNRTANKKKVQKKSTRVSEMLARVKEKKAKDKAKRLTEAYHQTLVHFFPDLYDRLDGLTDPRKESDYSMSELVMSAVTMFLFRRTSRNGMNLCRDDGNFESNYYRVFSDHRLAHMDTVDEVFRVLSPGELERLQVELVKLLIEHKVLCSFRLLDEYYLIAVDATGVLSFDHPHCADCIEKHYGGYWELPKKAIRPLRNMGFPQWVLIALKGLHGRHFESKILFIEAVEQLDLGLRAPEMIALMGQLCEHPQRILYSH
ncbi:hypothetical protein WDW89_12265, partial [Deltaproteobacteria bacterium TL4]